MDSTLYLWILQYRADRHLWKTYSLLKISGYKNLSILLISPRPDHLLSDRNFSDKTLTFFKLIFFRKMSLFQKTVKTLVPRATRSMTGISVISMRHLNRELVRSMSKLSYTVIRDLKMEMLDQNCETTNQAYRLFDVDGDGSLTAEEIS